jgi:hypothetical protein
MALVGHMVRETLFKVPPHVHRGGASGGTGPALYWGVSTGPAAVECDRGDPAPPEVRTKSDGR